MEIPNYDNEKESVTNYKQLLPYMPDKNFRMFIEAPSGSGKTNVLIHMMRYLLIYYDKLFIYSTNLEQGKYEDLRKLFDSIKGEMG